MELLESSKKTNLIFCNVDNGTIDLHDIVLKDTHVLKRFELENVSDSKVIVHISSDLSQVKFQLQNENLSEEYDQIFWDVIQNDDFNQVSLRFFPSFFFSF